jgi:hypothetical protein
VQGIIHHEETFTGEAAAGLSRQRSADISDCQKKRHMLSSINKQVTAPGLLCTSRVGLSPKRRTACTGRIISLSFGIVSCRNADAACGLRIREIHFADGRSHRFEYGQVGDTMAKDARVIQEGLPLGMLMLRLPDPTGSWSFRS